MAYGPTVGHTIGYMVDDAGLQEGVALSVDVFDSQIPATIVPDVLVDPGGVRMRG